ncbi:Lipopolysaccharide assembly protein B [bacterium HR33]|nr:Lipopolysaccharide assembly protein B [bacterium HR33]
MWERGVNKYAEGGFHNNAIALCNKILRYAPGRTEVYLRLAQLMVQRGFVAEAKQKLLEYADRMRKAGRMDEAFNALKEFADLSPDNEEIRLLLAEQLKAAARTDEARDQLAKLYAETQSTGDERRSRVTLEKIKAIDPEYDPEAAPKPEVKARPEKSSDLVFLDLGEPEPEVPGARGPEVAVEDLEPLQVEPTSLVEESASEEVAEAAPGEELEIERAEVLFESAEEGVSKMEGLEPTVLEEIPEVEAEQPPVEEGEQLPVGEAGEPQVPGPEEPSVFEGEELPVLELEGGQPIFQEGEIQETGIEVPELDLGLAGSLDLEEPAVLEAEAGLAPVGEVEVPSSEETAPEEPAIEVPMAEQLGAAAGAELEGGPPSISDLEARVADDPENPYLHQSLGEALIEAGERERGLEELDIALGQYEAAEQWSEAESLADEILRLDPNSVRHHQKRVEFAYRRNDRRGLVEAYLGLADALFRSGALDRARAVYQRVLEHDTDNERARAALATLEPEEAEGQAVSAERREPEPAGGGDFVDLGRLVLEDEEPRFKDTRLRVEDEEPTGDEQRDFEEMLSKFKEGIAATLSAEDAQAHYDLGVAFKEMGLLDEAIAEFQKALRAKEGRLRTSEALGVCFFEKGQYSVAATVLKRAVESDPSGDEEKIGLLYWLGRCEEELGRQAEALGYYQRVFAVDITFQDVSQRVKSLAGSGR